MPELTPIPTFKLFDLCEYPACVVLIRSNKRFCEWHQIHINEILRYWNRQIYLGNIPPDP